MVLVQKTKGKKGDIYISLGTSESALFKKVVTTEQEAATVLGILKKLSDEGTVSDMGSMGKGMMGRKEMH